MTSNTFSKKDQDFANTMSSYLLLNIGNLYLTLSPDEKINQLTAKQRELIGEFRLSIIRDALKEFSDLHPLNALKMMEESGA